jgi:drug/metabolite transporter (DMT)-like permease
VASPLPERAPFPLAGEAAALLSSVFWAAAGIVFRGLKGHVPPGAMNFGKNLAATAFFGLGALLAAPGAASPATSLEAHAWLALSGLLGLSACDTLFLRSLLTIGPRRASLVFMLAPVLVFLAALLPPFRQTHAAGDPLVWTGIALALAGIAGAAWEAPDRRAPPADERSGLRDALAASALQAAGVLFARLAMERGAAPYAAASLRLAWGTAGLLATALVLGRAGAWARALGTRRVATRLVPAAFFGTFLGIGLNQAGIAWAASTGVAATINSLSPVWLIPLSSAFLGERHGLRAWAATLLAVGGVALLSLAAS